MPSNLIITGNGNTQQFFVIQPNPGNGNYSYTGAFTATSESGSVATVVPGGNRSIFTVTAVGTGSTFIDVSGGDGSSGKISVTVTNNGTVINGKAPR